MTNVSDSVDYSCYSIPEHLFRFFSEEKGLKPEMLLRKNYAGVLEKIRPCYMMSHLRKVVFPLIRFYLETPTLSVEDLLNYDQFIIRDFAIFDQDFRFHKWMLENKLTMPAGLVRAGMHLGNIPDLCDLSGIEYLNREIASLSLNQQEKQTKFNQFLSRCIIREKERCLMDSLVPSSEMSWMENTVEDRFLEFQKRKEIEKSNYVRSQIK